MDDLLLQKYLRNETSEEELVEVLDWLDASTENQRYLDRLDYISNLNILAGEAQPRIRRRTVSLWKRAAQWSAAAAAVLLACAGLGHYMADRILERRTRDMMAITAPNGQSMSVTLSDGTTVWLNSGAKLEYPSIFSRKTRRVKISGEAMFEVEHDASRPFIVETFACDAEVLGTKFNILADARTADFSAALLEGRLKISNRLVGGESFILSPNDQIDLVDGHLKLNRITDPDDFRWVDGLMNLNTLSFGEVIRKFENYYGVRITIDNPEDMPELKYHGKIRVSDGVDHALKLLQITNNYVLIRHDDKLSFSPVNTHCTTTKCTTATLLSGLSSKLRTTQRFGMLHTSTTSPAIPTCTPSSSRLTPRKNTVTGDLITQKSWNLPNGNLKTTGAGI